MLIDLIGNTIKEGDSIAVPSYFKGYSNNKGLDAFKVISILENKANEEITLKLESLCPECMKKDFTIKEKVKNISSNVVKIQPITQDTSLGFAWLK